MKRSLSVILLVFVSGYAIAQSLESSGADYYKQGLHWFQLNKLKKADSLFTLALQNHPPPQTYYYMAMIHFQQKDTCAFCSAMLAAKTAGDTAAIAPYNSKCLMKRKINFSNQAHHDSVFFAYISKHRCSHLIVERHYYIKDLKTGATSGYLVDSAETSNDQIAGNYPFPNLNKFVKDKAFEVDDSSFYYIVDQFPYYPGGSDAMQALIKNNLVYPAQAKEKGIQGTVFVNIIIETDGSLSHLQITHGIGNGCDEEAIRVLKLMPKWWPAQSHGHPVRSTYMLAVRFL